ncbi:unnamed protein product (macronuclear) [Paramecium tetraurelia]|uniref:CHCH domain-containing protein n=1 Tax=Paramecium tetraurelia TaxID=5888 RepID=A0E1Q7_PARTE|nr:uncharacterized protein GSPATT00022395001 [Paramecium tetraurelia]CAK89224.1 unnamed protein product [Paramecium tetraurelia]|eukprot:XP_001456621.1 hypothetical protein (macronuclear) [Paramecium tetraurelia strain d4-2]
MNYRAVTYVPVNLRPSLARMNQDLQRCKFEAIQYAICASSKGYEVKEKQCQAEFEIYSSCLKKQ